MNERNGNGVTDKGTVDKGNGSNDGNELVPAGGLFETNIVDGGDGSSTTSTSSNADAEIGRLYLQNFVDMLPSNNIISAREILEFSGRCSGVGAELKNILTKLERPRKCTTGRLVRWDMALLVLQALTYGWYAIESVQWPNIDG